ncbi:MAG: c-type cytochrome domain-containing protein [Planctomycetota bacterium]|jgi:hypothetical protein
MRGRRLAVLASALLGVFPCACLDVSPDAGIVGGAAPPGDPQGSGPTTVSFSGDVLGIFLSDCRSCHGGAGGLDLESWSGVMAGGNSGPVVVPGDPDASLLIKRLDGSVLPIMPKSRPALTDGEIDIVRVWIQEGAQDN